ncbi:hypothetical protein [Aquimarina macrocephali]|uniref:hypothetical protein n=1 Tax=Aquimarina macrocephali TaxID=666563 RepID=UPI000466F7B8|nr:hypothetical protein [Aquimarina macrocephali]
MGYILIASNFDFTSIPSSYSNSTWDIIHDHDLNDATITIPENVILKFNGGKLKNGILTGESIEVSSESYQVFENIDFSNGILNDFVDVHWFGAKGDGITNDSNAIQKAVDLKKTVKLKDRKTYLLDSQILFNNGNFDSRLIYSEGLAIITSNVLRTSYIKIKGGSGDINVGANISGIRFEGRAGEVKDVDGIELAGCNGVRIDRCYFNNLRNAVIYNNEDANEFTEKCIVSDSRFIDNLRALAFIRNGGNDSFHGSGLDKCWLNGVNGWEYINIGAGCKLYNAILDFNAFGTTSVPIIKIDSVLPQTATGNIRLEGMMNSKIADGSNFIDFSGSITSLDNPYLGKLRLARMVKITGPLNGNIQIQFKETTTRAIKTSSSNQFIDLGNDATFYVNSITSRFIVTASNNNGGFPLISPVTMIKGDVPEFTNTGDTLKLIVPIAGTVVEITTVYNMTNPLSTNAGKVLENYEEI